MSALQEFSAIKSDDDLYSFLTRYALVEDLNAEKPASIGRGVLGVYVGQIEGHAVQVTHRWRDPSGPFQNEPDIHKAILQMAGVGYKEVEYEG
ncbi:hypothetical protein [Chromobacterium sp. ASV23]|uniref:hypothetical protein n=1 Tax=Chromobacterium sp. ASV23 TaxID=2795110 RepID=UPI0018EC6FE2|nr:hypothetical protein [Chromobacterium sp. ASV23]